MKAEITPEHEWLRALVGDWTLEGECNTGPDQQPIKNTGRETVRMIGDNWLVGEGEMQMPDGNAGQTMLTLGYDPKRGKFVGTWIGSMMNHHWVYEGSLDAAREVLTLDCEGPSFAGDGSMSRYQDIIDLSGGTRKLRSRVQGPDGQWNEFMLARYTRVGGAKRAAG